MHNDRDWLALSSPAVGCLDKLAGKMFANNIVHSFPLAPIHLLVVGCSDSPNKEAQLQTKPNVNFLPKLLGQAIIGHFPGHRLATVILPAFPRWGRKETYSEM